MRVKLEIIFAETAVSLCLYSRLNGTIVKCVGRYVGRLGAWVRDA